MCETALGAREPCYHTMRIIMHQHDNSVQPPPNLWGTFASIQHTNARNHVTIIYVTNTQFRLIGNTFLSCIPSTLFATIETDIIHGTKQVVSLPIRRPLSCTFVYALRTQPSSTITSRTHTHFTDIAFPPLAPSQKLWPPVVRQTQSTEL